MNKDEAIHKALKVLNCLNNDRVYETAWVKGAINACEEALKQPAQKSYAQSWDDTHPKQPAQEPRLVSYAPDGSTCTLNIDGKEVYFNREQPAQEPVAWMKSALDNARDVCKYLDHDMVKEAKAHTKFFWGDIDKIKEDEEALEQPVMAISQMNNDALKNALNNQGKLSVSSPQPQPAQEPVAWMKSALDNARDVCKYLDHDMVKEAKAHTKFFWGDIDKIKEDEEALEQPSQEPVAWMYYEKVTTSKEKAEIYVNNPIPLYTHPALQPAQEPVGVVSWHEGAVMGSIFPSSNMPKDGDKLYTHPHQWQGLTDDEYKQIVEVGFKLGYEACKCEQTLKEKNHG